MDIQEQLSITVKDLKSLVKEVSATIMPELKFTNTVHDEIIYESLWPLFNQKRIEEYKAFCQEDTNNFIFERIVDAQQTILAYNSETILLAYFLCTVRSRTLPVNWPIELTVLQRVYSDMGIAPHWAVI